MMKSRLKLPQVDLSRLADPFGERVATVDQVRKIVAQEVNRQVPSLLAVPGQQRRGGVLKTVGGALGLLGVAGLAYAIRRVPTLDVPSADPPPSSSTDSTTRSSRL